MEETVEHYLCECDSFKTERDDMVSWVKAELRQRNVQEGIVDSLQSQIIFGIALGMIFDTKIPNEDERMEQSTHQERMKQSTHQTTTINLMDILQE